MEITSTDLILNPDGSVFHLHLLPGQVAGKVILVGDPARVELVAGFFDRIEYRFSNREFQTITGEFEGKRISVISTGIGPDNIDIVMNELDALVNVDFSTKKANPDPVHLEIVRIGTSGSIRKEIPAGSFVVSTYALGLDNVLNYYQREPLNDELCMLSAFLKQTGWNTNICRPYFVRGSEELISRIGEGMIKGITATAPGFYGPQGRTVRIGLADPEMLSKFQVFSYDGGRIVNFEMETSALYGLGSLLGHHAVTVCPLIANRVDHTYISSYNSVINQLVGMVLARL